MHILFEGATIFHSIINEQGQFFSIAMSPCLYKTMRPSYIGKKRYNHK